MSDNANTPNSNANPVLNQQIELKGEWFDDSGFPAHLIDWAYENLAGKVDDDTRYFSLWIVDTTPRLVTIKVSTETNRDKWFGGKQITATIDLGEGKQYHLTRGEIKLVSHGETIQRWLRHCAENGPVWKVDWVLVRRYERDYTPGNCPAVMGQAFGYLDNMLIALLGREFAFRSETFIGMFGNGGQFRDRYRYKDTPPQIVAIFDELAHRFNHETPENQALATHPNGMGSHRGREQDLVRYRDWLRSLMRAILIASPEAPVAEHMKKIQANYELQQKFPKTVYAFNESLMQHIAMGEFNGGAIEAESWMRSFDPVGAQQTQYYISRASLHRQFLVKAD